ncbi:helix-turn-helix transcriptional regulator [Phytohabitans sp. ZYX-F-186]|uniref:Helix-turn-helix transcriptional regulator n=1 Tax=Phytohabitans maris TaxID=3071409 RepID=A0ABU0ZDN4_9ACTN|nr:helix-turn-helix transcriptional regulator [Phytohabitans sp. ZYX-F-186]MDQ7905159.1 helix-turn-helix transcriptional regulator [Phytohabitans sp. ZYX-F-186]
MDRRAELGRRLRTLRESKGLTQRELAGDFVTPSYVSRLEAGRRQPTPDVLRNLAAALDVNVSDLLGEPPTDAGAAYPDTSLLEEVLSPHPEDAEDYAAASAALAVTWRAARAAGDFHLAAATGMRRQRVLAALDEGAARIELLDELAALPQIGRHPWLYTMVEADRAAELLARGDLGRARELATAAAERVGDTVLARTATHVEVLAVLIAILVEQLETEPARTAIDTSLRVARSTGRSAVLGRAHEAAALALARMGFPEQARDHLDRVHHTPVPPTLPLREWIRLCRTSTSVLLDTGGDLADVGNWLQNAETAARLLGLPVEWRRVLLLRARYELAAGLSARCLRTTDLILSDPGGLAHLDTVRTRVTRARALALAGQRAEAVRDLRELALIAEDLHSYRMAVQIWRDIDQLRAPDEPARRPEGEPR